MTEIHTIDADPMQHPCEAVIVTVCSDLPLSPFMSRLDEALMGGIKKQIDEGVFTPSSGAVMVMPTFGRMQAMHLVVVGLGESGVLSAKSVQAALEAAIQKAYDWGGDDMAALLPGIYGGLDAESAARSLVNACRAQQEHVRRMDVLPGDDTAFLTVATVVKSALKHNQK